MIPVKRKRRTGATMYACRTRTACVREAAFTARSPEMEPQMDAEARRRELNKITEGVIGSAYKVANVLGCGFLEKVYENSMAHEMRRQGLAFVQQAPITINYDDAVVGEYVADFVVEDRILVELKGVRVVDEICMAQCLNYLNATGCHICLLINFGKTRVEVKRIVKDF